MYLPSDLSVVRPDNVFTWFYYIDYYARHSYIHLYTCYEILSTAETDFRPTPWISTPGLPLPFFPRPSNHKPVLEKSKIRLLSTVAWNDVPIRRYVVHANLVSGKLPTIRKTEQSRCIFRRNAHDCTKGVYRCTKEKLWKSVKVAYNRKNKYVLEKDTHR